MGFFLFPGAVLAGQGGESRGRFAGGPGRFFARSLFLLVFLFLSVVTRKQGRASCRAIEKGKEPCLI